MAKRFRFRLQTLLRVRELRERQALRAVGAKRAQIARLEQINRQTAEAILEQQREVVREQESGRVDPAELARRRAWIAHLRRTILERDEQIQRYRRELSDLLGAWHEARREKRVLERLRERRFEAWRRDARRAEQTADDEVVRQLQACGCRPVGPRLNRTRE